MLKITTKSYLGISDSAHVIQIACNTHSIVLNFVCTVNTSVHRHDSIAWGY